MLGWSQEHLASRAGVTRLTVADFERHARNLQRRNVEAIIMAFEAAGLTLIGPDLSGGEGVRFQLEVPA